MSITVRVATLSDSDVILKFLRESYYPEEPLTLALEPLQQAEEDEQFNLSNIQHGTCIIAYYADDDSNQHHDQTETNNHHSINENLEQTINIPPLPSPLPPTVISKTKSNIVPNELLGALIAGPKYPGEVEHLLDASKTVKNRKWSTMLKLLAYLEEQSNVFACYNITKAMHCHAVAVNPKSRGKSIGTKLIQKFMEICKELKFPAITFDCTSIYSIRLCENLNMDCINTIAFADYHNEHGEQVFRPPSPHKLIKTFAKRI